MNKKLLLAGFVVVAGFVALTGFGGQTLEQQKADIAKSVAAKLDAFRADKAKECDDRVSTEAKTRFDKAMAEKEAAMASKAPAKGMVKKGGKTPKAAPLPPAKKPEPVNPKDAKMEKKPNTDAKDAKMEKKANTDMKDAKMNKVKQNNGGN
jgi:hypothetical protein